MRNLAFCLLLLSGCSTRSERPEIVAEAPKEITPSAPELSITAMKLWQDYDENEVAADANYKDKWLLVSGSVSSIEKDLSSRPYVYLKSPNEIMRVPVRFKADETALVVTLRKGQEISVLCKCKGRSLGSPDLVKCVPR